MIKEISNFEDLLRSAGHILKQKKKIYQNSYEVIGTQIKSIADREMHDYLIHNIKKIRKNSFVVSEEDLAIISAKEIKKLEEFFIIDPIDGTASFIHGYQGYVLQMAFLKRGIPLFSIVYAPEFGDMYTAVKGLGAYLNGEIIKINNEPEQIVFIDSYPQPTPKVEKMMKINPGSSYMECGSIGLKICKIADGQANIFYKDVCLRDWDLVPPILILQEAGGSVFSLQKKKVIYFQKDDYSHEGVFAVSHSNMLKNLNFLEDIES